MKQFSVVIADQSDVMKSNLQILLKKHTNFEALALAYHIEEVNDICHNLQADVLFLNHNICKSPEQLQSLKSKLPHYTQVIYIAECDQHAALAFELDMIDYLIAPLTEARFNKSIKKILRQLESIDYTPLRNMQTLIQELSSNKSNEHNIIVKDSGRIRIIEQNEVLWVGGAGNYVELHLKDEERPILHRETLATMEGQLKNYGFVRIHRSAIVKKKSIRELKPTDNGDYQVTLKNGKLLNLSRRYKESMSGILK